MLTREEVTFLAVERGFDPLEVLSWPHTVRKNAVHYTTKLLERKAEQRKGMIQPIIQTIAKVFGRRR